MKFLSQHWTVKQPCVVILPSLVSNDAVDYFTMILPSAYLKRTNTFKRVGQILARGGGVLLKIALNAQKCSKTVLSIHNALKLP